MSGQEQKTLAIVGLGLIGASIAEATRKKLPQWRILGVSSSGTIKEALSLGLIDEGFGYDNVREALSRCDIGFLCTPIDKIVELLKSLVENPIQLKPRAVISDVGSIKTEICGLGKKAFPPDCGGEFIGSHPMAGSEKAGIKARDGHLFENAAWIICAETLEDSDPDEQRRINIRIDLEGFIGTLGARVIPIIPERHDFIVAIASHLPQVISTALASFVSQKGSEELQDILSFVGGGFKDMTRLAASKFTVWESILRGNRQNLEMVLSDFRKELEQLEKDLSVNGGKDFFNHANELRTSINFPRKGFSSPTTEILIDLEDKPGALLRALKPLSDAGLNILDLEILKVREGEEGVLMMGFRKSAEAEKALELLAASGHKARLR